MTHTQITQRIQELNCGDNYKLVEYLLEQGVDVFYVSPNEIVVVCESFENGYWDTHLEYIEASLPAIHTYLGY